MIAKLLEFLRKNVFFVTIFGVIGTSFVINLATLVRKIAENNAGSGWKYKLFFIVVAIVLTVIVGVLMRFVKKEKNNYPKLFVIIATVFGLIFLSLAPFFTGSDEFNHLYRIYEITDGVMMTPTGENYSGGELPRSLSDTFKIANGGGSRVKYYHVPEMLKVSLNPEEKIIYYSSNNELHYANTSLYSPVTYLPHMLGVSIGRAVSAGPYIIGLLGRVFNLLFYILIGYFAIKIMPKGKLFYLLILLSPVMMCCATTLSADTFMNVIFMLLLAMIMRARFREEKITRLEEVLIFALSVILSLCKICYMPLVMLVLLIQKEKFYKGKLEKYIFAGLTIAAATVLTLWWISCTGAIFDAAYPQSEVQKTYMLSHIFNYVVIVLRTIADSFVEVVQTLFLEKMYQSQVLLPGLVSLAYTVLVAVALFKKEKQCELEKIEKWLIGGVGLVIIGLILTALYVQCTAQYVEVAHLTIAGIQARYFIPVAFLLPFIVRIKKGFKLDEKKMMAVAVTITLIVWFHMMVQFLI